MSFTQSRKATIESIEKHLKETDWAGRRPEHVQFWFGTAQLTLVNERAVMECMIERLKSMKGPHAENQPCGQTTWKETKSNPYLPNRYLARARYAKRYRIHPGVNGPRVNPSLQ